MNDFVPSIGSRIQRNPLVPARSGNSSPRMASSGKPALMRARSNASASRSAMVTGESSAFSSTARSLARSSRASIARLSHCGQGQFQAGAQFWPRDRTFRRCGGRHLHNRERSHKRPACQAIAIAPAWRGHSCRLARASPRHRIKPGESLRPLCRNPGLNSANPTA